MPDSPERLRPAPAEEPQGDTNEHREGKRDDQGEVHGVQFLSEGRMEWVQYLEMGVWRG